MGRKSLSWGHAPNVHQDSKICIDESQVGQCSIEIADDADLLRLASEAGCCGLFIGIETTNSENLAAIDKGFNESERYPERLAKIRGAGIGVTAGMIVGLDGDDVEVFERTLRFLQRSHIDALQLNILTPLPGTPLFDEMKKTGRLVDHDWSHYDFRHAVFQPKRMKAEELQAGADWIYAQFYRLDRVLWRFARDLFSLNLVSALLCLKLGFTYRYDNKREHIVGWNPARVRPALECASLPGVPCFSSGDDNHG
jgi:radical SAM superfamily enzyme YgiQ (UPF0313 family)